ncbi:MAG: MerR family transcriptional regulator [Gammaproteobacteria bacterium]|nr:MerR family transcriptional regulator [Gammaproteobacteria bacterium]
MRSGELAKRAGVGVETLRFYEREGLLPRPARTRAGYRQYEQRDLEQVRLIRSCQEIGFTLREVKDVLGLHRVLAAPERAGLLKPRAQARLLAAAGRRLALIDEKLRTLEKMRTDMAALVATLAGQGKPVCPVSRRAVT